MKTKWIITSNCQEFETMNSLAECVKKIGRDSELHPMSWFSDNILYKKDDNDDCVIVIGTTLITRNISRVRPRWIPGSWHDPSVFKCSSYYAWFGKYITQQKYAFYPLSEIERKKDYIYSNFGVPDAYGDGLRVFIRPDEGEKIFDGGIVSLYYWNDWLQNIKDAKISKDTLCLVSQPLNIIKEYRLIMRKGKYITGSIYKINGMVEILPLDNDINAKNVINFAEGINTSEFENLPPMYVFDIAIEDNGRISLLEVGASTCAGLYACDLMRFAIAMSEEAEEEYKTYLI